MLLSLIGLRIYRQRVARPMERLMTGVEEMKQGALTRPFEQTGTVEIDQIGEVLNVVAADVKSRQDALLNENETLGLTLAERNAELERLLDEAKQNAQSRQRMLADVSHELRTPLTIIQGESDITLRNAKATEGELREALTRAKTAAEHTSGIVNDLLLISRQEEGQLKLDKKKTDLAGLVEDSSLLAPLPVSMEDAPSGLSALIDRLRMRQALLALMQNAKSHGASGARIRLARDGDTCRITVDDDGPGMSEADRAQAFSRFFRGSNAAGNYGGGFGLGLPIVRSIVEAHGGAVALDESAMGGLSVQLSLPLNSALRAVS